MIERLERQRLQGTDLRSTALAFTKTYIVCRADILPIENTIDGRQKLALSDHPIRIGHVDLDAVQQDLLGESAAEDSKQIPQASVALQRHETDSGESSYTWYLNVIGQHGRRIIELGIDDQTFAVASHNMGNQNTLVQSSECDEDEATDYFAALRSILGSEQMRSAHNAIAAKSVQSDMDILTAKLLIAKDAEGEIVLCPRERNDLEQSIALRTAQNSLGTTALNELLYVGRTGSLRQQRAIPKVGKPLPAQFG